LDLQEYLDAVHLSRKLQEKQVETLPQDKFESVINVLSGKFSVVFSARMHERFMQRDLNRLSTSFCQSPIGDITNEVVDDLLVRSSAWPVNLADAGFNPCHCVLSHLPSVGDAAKLRMFKKVVIDAVIVPTLYKCDCDNNEARLTMLLNRATAIIGYTDDLMLDTNQCRARNDFMEIIEGLSGLFGDIRQQHCKLSDILAIASEAETPSGSDMLREVSRAAYGGAAKAKIELIKANAQALRSVVPSMTEHTEALTTGENALASIVAASKFMVDHAPHVPDEEWLAPLRAQVKEAAEKLFISMLKTIQTALTSGASEEGVAVAPLIVDCRSLLSEVSLAFPMEDFHFNWTSELATHICEHESQAFCAQFFSSLSELSAVFMQREVPKPAAADKVGEFRGFLQKAVKGKHFQGQKDSDTIQDVLKAYVLAVPDRLSWLWQDTVEVLSELANFVGADAKICSQLEMGFRFCAHDCALSELAANLVPEKIVSDANWKTPLTVAKQRVVEISDLLATYSEQALSDDALMTTSVVDAFKNEMDKRHGAFQRSIDKVKDFSEARVATALTQWQVFANGDAVNKTIKWTAGKTFSEWDQWEAILAQYNNTVKKLKPKELVDAIKQGRNMAADRIWLSDILGIDFASELLDELIRDMCAIKMTSCIMRTLVKKVGPEEMRPAIRAEMLEAAPLLGGDFVDIDAWVPKAIADKIRGVISAKRKRAE
jgi:hypothetical protein